MPTPESLITQTAQETLLNTPIPIVRSGELLGTQGALLIDHKGAIYTLRTTSKGGLILTK